MKIVEHESDMLLSGEEVAVGSAEMWKWRLQALVHCFITVFGLVALLFQFYTV